MNDGNTDHARWLAGEFANTGNWKSFRALLRHVIEMQKRLKGELP